MSKQTMSIAQVKTMTSKQISVMMQIAQSEFRHEGFEANEQIWAFSGKPPMMGDQEYGGVLSSLVQAGLVNFDDHGLDCGRETKEIWFTPKGLEVAKTIRSL